MAYVDQFLPEDEPLLSDPAATPRRIGGAAPVSAGQLAARCASSPRPSARARWWRSAPAAAPRASGCPGTRAPGGSRRARTLSPSTSGWPLVGRRPAAGLASSGTARRRPGLAGVRRAADGAHADGVLRRRPQEDPDHQTAALRLLRPGGILAFDDVLVS